MKNLAMAVVVRDNKVLIQKRNRKTKGMAFEFPGGTVEDDETGAEAAVRELWEETGLKNVRSLASHTATNEFGGDIHYVVLGLNSDEEPKMVDAYRKQTFHWYQLGEIPLKDFFKADLDFIETHLSQCLSS